ncbi:hypothetical protein CPB83DRAFT_775117, partial [Crepidotus variabilis]
VNLACKAVLAAITNLDYAADSAIESDQSKTCTQIRASSLRRQCFADIASKHELELELLRDVDIRWSSTYLMIYRAVQLEPVIKDFLHSATFEELRRRCELSPAEWSALTTAGRILKVPFKFQQALSAEKTPTLCNTIGSFYTLMSSWKALQKKLEEENPDSFGAEAEIIQAGIDKLQEYFSRTDDVPACTVAMSKPPHHFVAIHHIYLCSSQPRFEAKTLSKTRPR